MKSERRHELQHNALADWLFGTFESVKPYQNVILTATLIAAIAVAAYALLSQMSSSRTTQAFNDLNAGLAQEGNVVKLNQVLVEHPTLTPAHVALVIIADHQLANGCDQLFRDKAVAQQELTKAVECYGEVITRTHLPLLLERAVFGLAEARESRGELDAAVRHYHEVLDRWPNGASPRGAAAAGRPPTSGDQGLLRRIPAAQSKTGRFR